MTMFDFNEEVKKFKPSLEVDSIEENVQAANVEDLLGILQKMTKAKEINLEKE